MPICQVCGKEINWLESLDFGNGQKFCSDKCYQTILPNLPKNLLFSHKKFGENIGISAGETASAQNYADNVVFSAERGHGFAAEKANHLFDKFIGKDATLTGSNNIKNGADRLVDGVQIQTKYCASGSKCVRECFDGGGNFRYWNRNGTPMQIEVPFDRYEDAVKAMADRIRKGQIKGVNNPEKAKEIIRRGNFNYETVRLIAKAGTIQSLTYDTVNGIQLAGTAASLSAVITFASAIWNGEDFDAALEIACYSGLKVGGIAWVSSIITAQIGRTGLEQGLRTTTDWMVQQIGPKAASWIATGLRSGNALYGAAAMNYVSKLLWGNIVTTAITTLVLSAADLYRMFDGRISGTQLFKNVSTTAVGVAGGVGGWQAGAAAGATLGSAVPILGTVTGGIIGGLLGSLAGGAVAQSISKTVLDKFIEDDAKEMSKILETVFVEEAQLYLLGKNEAETVIEKLRTMDLPDKLRDMYADSNREYFAKNLLSPLIEHVISNRKKISLPSDEQLLKSVGKIIDKLVDNIPPTLQS